MFKNSTIFNKYSAKYGKSKTKRNTRKVHVKDRSKRSYERKEGWLDTGKRLYNKYGSTIWKYGKHFLRPWLPFAARRQLPSNPTTSYPRRVYSQRGSLGTRPGRRSIVPYANRSIRNPTRTQKYVATSTRKPLQSKGQYYHQITDDTQLKLGEQTIAINGELFAIREIGADPKRFTNFYSLINPVQAPTNFNPQQLIVVGTGENQRIGTNIKISSYRVRLYIVSAATPIPSKLRFVAWLDKTTAGVDASLYSTPNQPTTVGGPYNSFADENQLFTQTRNSTNMQKYDIIHTRDFDLIPSPATTTAYGIYPPQLHEFHFDPEHTCTYTTSTGLIADVASNCYKFSLFCNNNTTTNVSVFLSVDIHYRDA